MDSHSVAFLFAVKTDMHLAAHLGHAIDKAALYDKHEVSHIWGSVIFLVANYLRLLFDKNYLT